MTMKRRKRVNLGSISSGTMRAEDLIPTFISELRAQRPLHRSHRKVIRSIEADMRGPGEFFEDGDASEAVNELMDALGDYAPEGFYFGSHPGDGADYGFWLSDDFVDEFDGERVSDTSEVPRGFTGMVLHTNDHGNLTLYRATRGRLSEVWAIV